MTFPKYRNIEGLIIKSNKILSRNFFAILFEFRKNARFSKLHLGSKKMFTLSGMILEVG